MPGVGDTIDRFVIEAVLGEGGMGRVYRALDGRLGRRVALKVLLTEGMAPRARADAAARMVREARAAAAFNHPNVVAIYDVGETEGSPYIAMELVLGETLRRFVGEAASFAEKASWLEDVARGLAAAHRAGLVHRDIKPENVMVTAEGTVKILDFGIARRSDRDGVDETAATAVAALAAITSDGAMIGTPQYMPPEQLKGDPVDGRCDQFAWAVTAFELLSGKSPWGSPPNAAQLIATVMSVEAPRLDALVPTADARWVACLSRALEKSPAARFDTMEELLHALGVKSSNAPAPAETSAVAYAATAEALGALSTTAAPVVPGTSARPAVPAPPPAPAPRKARLAPWLAFGASALLVAGAVARLSFRDGAGASKEVALPADAAPVPTAITALPPPQSRSAEALAEYAAGMQALRDDSYGLARGHFQRAADIDDTLAMAHLHIGMSLMFSGDATVRHDHWAKAVAFRSQLGARDRAFLEAFEPALGLAQPDRGATFDRLVRLSATYPGDVEILDQLGVLRSGNPQSLAYADRAIALDPRDAQAWETRGRALAIGARLPEARAALEKCAASSPASSDCFVWIARMEAGEGRCAEAEAAVRHGLDRDGSFLRFLPGALLGAGRPLETVRDAMTRAEALTSGEDRRRLEMEHDGDLAIFAGDFARARTRFTEAGAMLDGNPTSSFESNLDVVTKLARLAIETGNPEEAGRLARRFILRSDDMPSSNRTELVLFASMWITRQAVRSGALTLDEFRARRDAWAEARRKAAEVNPGLVWAFGYAAPAETPDEARAALAVLPGYLPLEWFPGFFGHPEGPVGHAYLLAGRPDDAIPYLRKAAGSCLLLDGLFVRPHADLDLGAALEAKGDRDGACGAYKKVLDRWGAARPRSVTADAARDRSRALRCGG